MIATVSKVQCLNDCKRKFYFQYIEKIPVEQTKALKKGSNVHSLLENIENLKEEDTEEFKIVLNFKNSDLFKKYEDVILNSEREKGIGIKIEAGKLVPCEFSDEKAIFRGRIDLLGKDTIIDYKTGKFKDNQDFTQLEWYAIWLFLKNPDLGKIKISFLYVEHLKENSKVYYKENLKNLIKNFLEQIKPVFAFEREPKNIPNRTWKCDYCQFKSECDKDFLGDLNELF